MLIVCDLNLLENAQCDYWSWGPFSRLALLRIVCSKYVKEKHLTKCIIYHSPVCVCVIHIIHRNTNQVVLFVVYVYTISHRYLWWALVNTYLAALFRCSTDAMSLSPKSGPFLSKLPEQTALFDINVVFKISFGAHTKTQRGQNKFCKKLAVSLPIVRCIKHKCLCNIKYYKHWWLRQAI